MTVSFADVSGYTAVAERLDHEMVKALIDRCLTRLAAEVERYGGRIDKFIGDSVMAVFGAPVSHEDDPERAVRASIAMQQAMVELNESIAHSHRFELALRIGINTGEVLAGRVGDAYTVTGDTVNVAARQQAAGPVGGILVGDRTRRATAAAVEYRPGDQLTLKGKHDPVQAFEVIGLRDRISDRERQGRRQTPLVGRREELAELETLFERVLGTGEPRMATIVGQAGVGKSRVLGEFERTLAARSVPVAVRHGRCLPFGTRVAFWPLSEMLRAECGIADGDPGTVAFGKLEGRLRPLLSAHAGEEAASRRIAPLARWHRGRGWCRRI